ncbi:MAG: efflux RND transporter periplasmic adaptor subunit, partial [Chitinophagaceae bacterium]|nr:efflux RND transporter periplasmic adaptor subunit [Chitinophagaceae bacterium]
MKPTLKQLWLNAQMHLINFKTSHMKFQFRYLVIILISVVACNNKTASNNSLEVEEVIPVTTFTLSNTVGSKDIQVTGVLSIEQEVKYSFKVGGVVDKIFIENGAYFKKGKLLATLKENEIEAGLLQSKLALEKAERDLKRVASLFKDSVATLEQYQNATTAFNIAKQQYESIAFNKEYSSIYAQRDGFVIKKIAQQGEIVASGSPILLVG